MASIPTPGGWSAPKKATPNIQEYAGEVKPQVEKYLGTDFKTYKAVSYRQQVVAGMNYLIKIDVGGTNFIQVRLFVSLEGLVEFESARAGLTETDQLEPAK